MKPSHTKITIVTVKISKNVPSLTSTSKNSPLVHHKMSLQLENIQIRLDVYTDKRNLLEARIVALRKAGMFSYTGRTFLSCVGAVWDLDGIARHDGLTCWLRFYGGQSPPPSGLDPRPDPLPSWPSPQPPNTKTRPPTPSARAPLLRLDPDMNWSCMLCDGEHVWPLKAEGFTEK